MYGGYPNPKTKNIIPGDGVWHACPKGCARLDHVDIISRLYASLDQLNNTTIILHETRKVAFAAALFFDINQ